MTIINEIDVNAANRDVEASVNFLNQADQTYQLLEQTLPPGRFKKELLQFTARKREEYIKNI